MRKTSPRRNATSNIRTTASASKLSADVFSNMVTGSTRLANGANSQNEEGINKAITELLAERTVNHAVVVPGADEVIRPKYATALFSHHRCPLSKSIVAIVARNGDDVFSYFFILEGTGTITDQYYVNGTPNERNESQVTATADMIFDLQARRLVTHNFAVRPQIDAEEVEDYVYPFCVIPTSCTPDATSVLANFVDNAIDAIDSCIRDSVAAEREELVVTLTDYIEHSTPRLSLDFNPDHTAMTATGSPMRSDARARLRIEVGNRNKGDRGRGRGHTSSINEAAQDLAEVSAFTDISFFKDGLGEYNERSFLPVINVTNATTGAANPDLRHLSHLLWTISQLTVDARWKQTLDAQKLLSNGKDLNSLISDIDELYDHNGNIVDIDDLDLNSTAENGDLFLDLAFEDAPVVQIRIPRGDATTWAYNPILAAVTDTGINELIIDNIDKVSGGTFKANLHREGLEDLFLFEANTDVVHVGYYIDANGEHRDLAEIDYLQVATWSQGTAEEGAIREEWEETFFNDEDVNDDIGSRLNRRLEIIADVAGGMGNVHVTGYADVITCNPMALFMITETYRDANFKPRSPEATRVRARSRGNRNLRDVYQNNRGAYDARDDRRTNRRRGNASGVRRVRR